MSNEQLAFRPAVELAAMIRAKEISPVEVVECFLDRIATLDDRIGAYLTLCADAAREGARRAERTVLAGEPLGPLHGVPYSLKDNVNTAGLRTTAGLKQWLDRVPERDAPIATQLREAGGILLGKVNLHELALGNTTDNRQVGLTTHNPWDLERVPGGSSGGSAAAVAAGLSPVSIGSDTGGSIRGPASFCGVVGLKPTYGRVGRRGVAVNSWSLDHLGPLARTVGDIALLLGVIAGHDPLDPSTSRRPVPSYADGLDDGVAGLRLGILQDEQLAPCWPAARASYQAAVELLARNGAEIVPVRLDLLAYSRQAQRLIAAPEIAQAHEALLRSRADEFSDDIRTMLEQGAMIPAVDYLRGQRLRRLAQEELRGHFRRVDTLLTPTCIGPAPRIGEKTARLGDGGTEEPLMFAFARYTTAFSVPGAPAISVPAGADEQGLPLGLQVAGRPFDEPTVLRVAAAWERLAPWQDRIPPIAAG